MSDAASITEALTKLRKIVGDEPKEAELLGLLQRCGGDANAAANAYFDGGVGAGDPFPSGNDAVPGMPVAEPLRPQGGAVAVSYTHLTLPTICSV